MSGVNKVILIGNLTKDPELKYTPSGVAVCNFGIACNETYKDKDGVKQEKVEFINIVVWRQLAEVCAKYLQKGKQIFVEGKIQNRSYDDRDGNKRYISEVVIHDMTMLGGRDGGGQNQDGSQNREEPQQQQQQDQGYNQRNPTYGGGQQQQQNHPNQQQNAFEEPVFNPDDDVPF